MAQLNARNYELATTERNTEYKVGNNRNVMVDDYGIVTGHLHGNKVFDWNPASGVLTLDTCGYPTRTTVSAMEDFQRLVFGVPLVVVSRRGGECQAHELDGNDTIRKVILK